jgi:hypothetical protein
VNGFCTVIGSVGAMILAMIFGFRIVLAVAGAWYLVSLAAITVPRVGVVRRPADPRDGRASAEKLERRSPRADEAVVSER